MSERLKQIKESKRYYDQNTSALFNYQNELTNEQIEWLTEQAGKVEDWEKAYQTSIKRNLEANARNDELLVENAQLRNQMERFEYLASYELSHQHDNAKNNRSRFQKGALEGMENYNRKWKDATGREIKPLW